MGVLHHISQLFHGRRRRSSRCKPMQTVEIKVKMDCEGCERSVRQSLSSMKGVRSVEVYPKQSRVKVCGHVEPKKVLQRVTKKLGRKAEIWPYVAYNLVSYPYVKTAYDKKAPAGYVRNVVNTELVMGVDDPYATLFSDENAHACSIM